MNSLFPMIGLAFALTGGVAAAQTAETTTEQTTTAPQPMAPVPGSVVTSHESHAVDPYGNRVDSSASSYRDDAGVSRSSRTITTQGTAVAPLPAPPPPPPPQVTTSTTTTRTTTTGVPNY